MLGIVNPNTSGLGQFGTIPVTGPSPVRLHKLYVSADAIGTGVGAALMRAGIDWATGTGYESMWLGVWEHNHRAMAFYERWGSSRSGPRHSDLGRTIRSIC